MITKPNILNFDYQVQIEADSKYNFPPIKTNWFNLKTRCGPDSTRIISAPGFVNNFVKITDGQKPFLEVGKFDS